MCEFNLGRLILNNIQNASLSNPEMNEYINGHLGRNFFFLKENHER